MQKRQMWSWIKVFRLLVSPYICHCSVPDSRMITHHFSVTVGKIVKEQVFCVFLFDSLSVAIYLAKRNIRKKGLLEPYEQVCAHATGIFVCMCISE